jgi:DNA-binding transcriptional LysR family regulator
MIMILNSSQIEAFGAVAKTANFTTAARKIGITQSALSQRIFNLESELRTTLLIRGKSGITLTEAGQKLLRYCRTREQLEAELLNGLSAGGILRIGGYSSVMRSVVLEKLEPFLKKNPAIQPHFMTRELTDLPALFRSGEIDYMILDRKLESEQLETIQIGVEEYVLVQARNYSGGEVYLDHDPEDDVTERYLRVAKSRLKYQRAYFDDVYGVLDAAKRGLGKAVMPKHLLQGENGLEILHPQVRMKNSVVLHFYKQPYYSKLHEHLLAAFTAAQSRSSRAT